KFHFSFQKVLDVKEKEKEQAQLEFGVVKRAQTELLEKIDRLHALKESYLTEYNHVHQKTVLEILQIQEHINEVERHIRQLTLQCNQLDQEVDTKQQVLVDRAKEEKVWQQLKKKSFDSFQKQMEQKEQAILDEMAVLRFSRPM
ncbi:MAG TPA: flagellar export protein FliJ, partial [Bacillota bacterium]|nr:flagellar export protein FliJ [Bacillota bacterium]